MELELREITRDYLRDSLQHENFSVPGSINPRSSRSYYQLRLKQSLLSYLTAIEKKFKENVDSIRSNIQSLDYNRRFSPKVYVAHAWFGDGVKAKDPTPIFDGMLLLSTLELESHYQDHYELSTIGEEAWELPFINFLRSESARSDLGQVRNSKVYMLPFQKMQLSAINSEYEEALKLIKTYDPEVYIEFETYVSQLKLFRGQVLQGATSPRFFGNVFLRVPNPVEDPLMYFIEHLVHETSHLHLFSVMSDDPIVENREDELFFSPIRDDRRPMFGVTHASFVLSRIVRIFRRMREAGYEHPHLHESFENAVRCFEEAFEVVRKSAKVTDLGREVVQSLKTCAYG